MFGKCVLVRSNSDSEASAVEIMSCVVLENQGEPPEISRKCPIYYLYRNETRLALVIGKYKCDCFAYAKLTVLIIVSR